jgi:hypothetical protein
MSTSSKKALDKATKFVITVLGQHGFKVRSYTEDGTACKALLVSRDEPDWTCSDVVVHVEAAITQIFVSTEDPYVWNLLRRARESHELGTEIRILNPHG